MKIYFDGAKEYVRVNSLLGWGFVAVENDVIRHIAAGTFMESGADSMVAEVHALHQAMEWALASGVKTAEFIGDSSSVIAHMSGRAKIHRKDKPQLIDVCFEKIGCFEAASFSCINNRENVIADAVCEQAMQKVIGKRKRQGKVSVPAELLGPGMTVTEIMQALCARKTPPRRLVRSIVPVEYDVWKNNKKPKTPDDPLWW